MLHMGVQLEHLLFLGIPKIEKLVDEVPGGEDDLVVMVVNLVASLLPNLIKVRLPITFLTGICVVGKDW